MRGFVTARYPLAVWFAASILLTAQRAPHFAARKPAPRGKTTVLSVSCDTECTWTLDGTDENPIAAGGTARLSVEPGQHLLVATTADGQDQIKKDFTVEDGGDAEFELRLLRVRIARLKKELADQEEKIRAFNAGQGDGTPDADAQQVPGPAPAPAPTSLDHAQEVNQSPAPPPVPMPATKLEISPQVTGDMLIARTLPEYPPTARAMGISGTVVLHGTITRDGLVTDLAVVSGPELLQKAAMDAVSTWKYTPYMVNGHAVDVTTTFRIEFKLNSKAPAGASG